MITNLINKHQQGGQLQQQIVQLVQAAMSGNKQATDQINKIMQAAKNGDKQATQLAQYIQQIVQQMQTPKAKSGMKLNNSVVCKEGEIPIFLKRGGTICKVCQKLQQGKSFKKIVSKLFK